jgi:hypothetical protein
MPYTGQPLKRCEDPKLATGQGLLWMTYNFPFGCWYRSRKKVSIAGTIRPRAVFAQSEACYAAQCLLVRPESHKYGAVPYKTVERTCYAAIRRLGCPMMVLY